MRTRHNTGFMALEAFAARCDGPARTKKTADYIRTDLRFGPHELIAIKPVMYMNNSGHALASTGINWAGAMKSVLVVCDDVALELGRIRLRSSGSAGGHNGIKNIIDVLGTREIPRLRVGIGNNPEFIMTDYVLQPFTKDERRVLPDALELAADAIQCAVEEGLNAAMNKFNAKSAGAES
jgi:PTH1 family peptidyl-tRNA hydrolase